MACRGAARPGGRGEGGGARGREQGQKDLAAITIAHLGNPPGAKRGGLFSKAPRAAHSLVLKLGAGAQGERAALPSPLHLEFDEERALRACMGALRALAPEMLITQG